LEDKIKRKINMIDKEKINTKVKEYVDEVVEKKLKRCSTYESALLIWTYDKLAELEIRIEELEEANVKLYH
jgi:hypothetical protein